MINNLYWSFDIAFVNKSYGGRIGRVNIIQKVSRNDKNDDTEIAKMMLVVNDMLPEYHTRHKKKIFMENYKI